MTKQKSPLTPLQKVLLVNGGFTNRLRQNHKLARPPKKGRRRDDA